MNMEAYYKYKRIKYEMLLKELKEQKGADENVNKKI